MLAASVNFKIKFVTLAFVEGGKARTLNRADVNKSIGLAIIAHQEAKALHRIEEFDCARDPFTRKLALRSSRGTRLNSYNFADNLEILRGDLATTINQVEFKLLPFGKAFQAGTLNRADVHEHIFAAGFLLDEAKTLLRVEELHHAFTSADNLRRHAAETASTSTGTAATAARSTATAATRAAATAAKAITTAKATAIIATAAIIPEVARWLEAISTAKRIETFFAEPVALVTAAPTPPIVTHKSIRTLHHCPQVAAPIMRAVSRTGRWSRKAPESAIKPNPFIAHKQMLCE
jgi:hypothetical protein